MTYLTGGAPVGAYNPDRLSTLGLGHAAIDAGGGYTYLNSTTGREFSAGLGFTYNWKNKDTNVKNGIDSHLDWAASQFLSDNWQVGVVDPEVGYAFKFNGQPTYTNLRGCREFTAQNRIEGDASFAAISILLGSCGK